MARSVWMYLTQNLPESPSRTFVKRLIEAGNVTSIKKAKANHKVTAGDEVGRPRCSCVCRRYPAVNIPLDIVYEDENILLINKPQDYWCIR